MTWVLPGVTTAGLSVYPSTPPRTIAVATAKTIATNSDGKRTNESRACILRLLMVVAGDASQSRSDGAFKQRGKYGTRYLFWYVFLTLWGSESVLQDPNGYPAILPERVGTIAVDVRLHDGGADQVDQSTERRIVHQHLACFDVGRQSVAEGLLVGGHNQRRVSGFDVNGACLVAEELLAAAIEREEIVEPIL